ncbi:MAG: hypothetical protein FJZ79_07395 [Chlorobi bacterium]|nr:hypothetical protein [Chlorobiota bacterium]
MISKSRICSLLTASSLSIPESMFIRVSDTSVRAISTLPCRPGDSRENEIRLLHSASPEPASYS